MFVEDNYTDQHIHPGAHCPLGLVAYERRDSGWDVFAFEPVGSVPELEANRSDESHIFLRRIESPREIDTVASETFASSSVLV